MKKIYFVVFLAFANFILNAQDIGLTPPNGTFGGLNLGDNGVVGAIGGTVNVSELARLCELSRPTIYKYLELMHENT